MKTKRSCIFREANKLISSKKMEGLLSELKLERNSSLWE